MVFSRPRGIGELCSFDFFIFLPSVFGYFRGSCGSWAGGGTGYFVGYYGSWRIVEWYLLVLVLVLLEILLQKPLVLLL